MTVVEAPAERVRCYARSKRTGEQCGRLVRAAGHLCRYHGGKNPVVAARQDLEAGFSRNYKPPAVVADPLSSIEDMLGLSQQIVSQLRVVTGQTGMASTEQMTLLGSWMDRLMRFAQTVQTLQGLRIALDEGQGRLVQWVLEGVLADLGHDVTDPNVREVVARRLRQLVELDGQVPA